MSVLGLCFFPLNRWGGRVLCLGGPHYPKTSELRTKQRLGSCIPGPPAPPCPVWMLLWSCFREIISRMHWVRTGLLLLLGAADSEEQKSLESVTQKNMAKSTWYYVWVTFQMPWDFRNVVIKMTSAINPPLRCLGRIDVCSCSLSLPDLGCMQQDTLYCRGRK